MAKRNHPERQSPASMQVFDFDDAWLLAAIRPASKSGAKLDLAKIVSAADWLNHAIPNFEECRNAFRKLQAAKIISIRGDRLYVNVRGRMIFEAVDRKRGGLFTRIDECLKALNSLPGVNLRNAKSSIDLGFITKKRYQAAIATYWALTEARSS